MTKSVQQLFNEIVITVPTTKRNLIELLHVGNDYVTSGKADLKLITRDKDFAAKLTDVDAKKRDLYTQIEVGEKIMAYVNEHQFKELWEEEIF